MRGIVLLLGARLLPGRTVEPERIARGISPQRIRKQLRQSGKICERLRTSISGAPICGRPAPEPRKTVFLERSRQHGSAFHP